MNLVFFSLKTKGPHNFVRRLWTVFTRFDIREARTRRALYTVIDVLRSVNSAPTFFIPAVVLHRHPQLIMQIVGCGAEVGVHGYVHNDYRFLSKSEQYQQTKQAVAVFEKTQLPHEGFRNPYLGWTEASLAVFAELGFTYDSNEAVFHDVVHLDHLPSHLRSGYEKSLTLFQAIPCNAYTLRPHFEGALLRIPTSIPDDEMLFDRLRITNPEEMGRIWSTVAERVYALGGVYTLNLHPERAILCKRALDLLLSCACNQPLPVWVARLKDIAQWWKERSLFRLRMTPEAANRWRVEVTCTSRATLLARHLLVEDQQTTPWFGADLRVATRSCIVSAKQCPCIGISSRTPQQVADFLLEQGYPVMPCSAEEAHTYALYLDMPAGLGTTREEQLKQRSTLVQRIEGLEAPFLHFGCWPDACRLAVSITGDIDSVTVQDFFLRILEVKRHA
jgi:peptidoglycan/xylan/chitin deacetylase (PgdA/CDA1 family)